MTTTPAQTIGPFFSFALQWSDGPYALSRTDEGALSIGGRVLDGAGEPVPDALVETWQGELFTRSATGPDGVYELVTAKPPARDGAAPHLTVTVLARGLLHRLVTRVYFPDEAAANAADPVLSSVDADRRGTLVAAPAPDAALAFDIVLQGQHETVFFAL